MIGISIAFVASMCGIVAYLISAYRFDRRTELESVEHRRRELEAADHLVVAEAEMIVAIARIKGTGA